MRNIIKQWRLQWTNEHTSLKKYIFHPLISKGWCFLCVRDELETGTDCYILTLSSSDHSSTSYAFWLGCSTVGHRRLKALRLSLALSLASCLATDSNSNWNWLKPFVAPGFIIVIRQPASAYLHRCISWLTARSRVNMY